MFGNLWYLVSVVGPSVEVQAVEGVVYVVSLYSSSDDAEFIKRKMNVLNIMI